MAGASRGPYRSSPVATTSKLSAWISSQTATEPYTWPLLQRTRSI